MGLFSYYRRYIKNFAQIALPLYKLLQKNEPWVWLEPQINAFSTLVRLSKDLRVKNSNFEKATVDSALMESLTLADQDFSTYILDTNLHSVDHAQALANCFLLQNILNILKHDSNLYVPRCTKVLNIFPVLSPDVCFQDVPVIIPRAEGGNFTAFLTKTGIIRKVSKIVTCKNVTIEINI